MARNAGLPRKLLLGLIPLVLLAVAVEIGARLWLVHAADDESFQRYASLRQLAARYGEGAQGLRDLQSMISHAHHRYLGFYPTPNFQRGANRHNALGYRGEEIVQPKPEGEFRIVCLGGSTTYTSGLEDYRRAYPYVLQEALRSAGHPEVTVVNAGAPGWSSWESLVNLQFRVLDLDPDLILVLHGINDIEARLVWPPESYRGDNSGRRRSAASAAFMPGLLEHSTVLRYFLVRSGRIRPHLDAQRTVDPPSETYVGKRFTRQKAAGSYPKGVFEEASAQEILDRNRPEYFARNLSNIVLTASARRVGVVLMTFNYDGKSGNDPRATSPEFVAAYAQMNRVVEEVAATTRAGLIDLAGEIPQDARYYFPDGHHMRPEGVRLKVELIARYLLENELLR